MLLPIAKLFRFESQLSRHDQLRRSFKPRLEWLEHRLAPSVNVFSPGDQQTLEGAGTSFPLGSFNDTNPPNANIWQVDVNWGDSSPDTTFATPFQGILPTRAHTYGEEGNYIVTVSVTNTANVSGFAMFNVFVADPAVLASAVNFSATPNVSLNNQPVATFVDPGGAEPNAFDDPNGTVDNHYAAVIDWGDFTGTSPGTITLANGIYTVTGNHTYNQNGPFTTTVSITHESAPNTIVQGTVNQTTTSPITITPPNNGTGSEGISGSLDLGSFTDTNPGASLWNIDVNWGDNTTDTTFTTTSQGSIGGAPHLFGEEGTYTVTINVADNQGSSSSTTFTVSVADPAVVAAASNFTVGRISAFTQAVATFTDPGGAEPNAADPIGSIGNHYTATIDWGDNSGASTGQITLNGNFFTVTGSHTYSQAGAFTTTVTIMHESAPATTVQGRVTVTQVQGPTITSAGNQTAVEGIASSLNLGSFTDSNSSATSWTVDVNWGDNTPHATFTTTGQGTLGSQAHIYGEEGTYTVTATVTNNLGVSGTATFQVNVSDPAVVASAVSFPAPINGALNNQTVATFTDPGGAEPNAADPGGPLSNHYSAIIVWGDNSFATPGTITQSNGVFTVTGSHTYAQGGTFTTSVIILHESAPQTTVQGTASVGITGLLISSPGNQTASAGTAASFNLGSFSDTTPGANSWTVSVNWGDNTTPTTFTTTTPGSLGSQSHTYAQAGNYTATVRVTDNLNVSNSATFQVSVSGVTNAVTVTSPGSQTATAGTATPFNLGSFSDTTPGASSWTVTVNWGDNTSPTTFTTNSQGSLGSQSHTYAQAGTYTATVTVTDNQNVSGSTTFQVTVSSSNVGLINFVNFETGNFNQLAAHQGGAIVTSPTLSGSFALQLLRNNSVAWAEIRQNGSTFYNLPTAFYSFQFQYASQTGEGGIVNFQDANGNYKAALHLSPSGKLLFYDANGNLLAVGTTTLLPNQTYTISAKIGTGVNAPFQILVNGNVELSGTGNLGAGNNGSIRLGGNSAYTTNYYYDNIAIAANGFPGTNALTVTPPANQTATAGTATPFNLGSFSDTTPGASSWTVTVNWGDNTSPTTFTTNSQGSLGSQSHTYAQAGTYTATVTVTDNQNVSGSTTFQVTVSSSNVGLINFVNFETGNFNQLAAHQGGAIVTSPTLSGSFALQLLRNNSVAWAEIRQNGSTFYNLPTAFYSFQFQYASQTGAGGIVNFQDANGNYKAALHLSPSGQLQ